MSITTENLSTTLVMSIVCESQLNQDYKIDCSPTEQDDEVELSISGGPAYSEANTSNFIKNLETLMLTADKELRTKHINLVIKINVKLFDETEVKNHLLEKTKKPEKQNNHNIDRLLILADNIQYYCCLIICPKRNSIFRIERLYDGEKSVEIQRKKEMLKYEVAADNAKRIISLKREILSAKTRDEVADIEKKLELYSFKHGINHKHIFRLYILANIKHNKTSHYNFHGVLRGYEKPEDLLEALESIINTSNNNLQEIEVQDKEEKNNIVQSWKSEKNLPNIVLMIKCKLPNKIYVCYKDHKTGEECDGSLKNVIEKLSGPSIYDEAIEYINDDESDELNDLLGKIFKLNNQQKTLDLSKNDIGDECCNIIAQKMSLANFSEINLSNNNITDIGANKIKNSLIELNNRSIVVKLEGNKISSKVLYEIQMITAMNFTAVEIIKVKNLLEQKRILLNLDNSILYYLFLKNLNLQEQVCITLFIKALRYLAQTSDNLNEKFLSAMISSKISETLNRKSSKTFTLWHNIINILANSKLLDNFLEKHNGFKRVRNSNNNQTILFNTHVPEAIPVILNQFEDITDKINFLIHKDESGKTAFDIAKTRYRKPTVLLKLYKQGETLLAKYEQEIQNPEVTITTKLRQILNDKNEQINKKFLEVDTTKQFIEFMKIIGDIGGAEAEARILIEKKEIITKTVVQNNFQLLKTIYNKLNNLSCTQNISDNYIEDINNIISLKLFHYNEIIKNEGSDTPTILKEIFDISSKIKDKISLIVKLNNSSNKVRLEHLKQSISENTSNENAHLISIFAKEINEIRKELNKEDIENTIDDSELEKFETYEQDLFICLIRILYYATSPITVNWVFQIANNTEIKQKLLTYLNNDYSTEHQRFASVYEISLEKPKVFVALMKQANKIINDENTTKATKTLLRTKTRNDYLAKTLYHAKTGHDVDFLIKSLAKSPEHIIIAILEKVEFKLDFGNTICLIEESPIKKALSDKSYGAIIEMLKHLDKAEADSKIIENSSFIYNNHKDNKSYGSSLDILILAKESKKNEITIIPKELVDSYELLVKEKNLLLPQLIQNSTTADEVKYLLNNIVDLNQRTKLILSPTTEGHTNLLHYFSNIKNIEILHSLIEMLQEIIQLNEQERFLCDADEKTILQEVRDFFAKIFSFVDPSYSIINDAATSINKIKHIYYNESIAATVPSHLEASNKNSIINALINNSLGDLIRLIPREVDINFTIENGNNLLHIALNKACSDEIIQLLVNCGVSLTHKNEMGQTPLTLASFIRQDMVKYFIQSGAKYFRESVEVCNYIYKQGATNGIENYLTDDTIYPIAWLPGKTVSNEDKFKREKADIYSHAYTFAKVSLKSIGPRSFFPSYYDHGHIGFATAEGFHDIVPGVKDETLPISYFEKISHSNDMSSIVVFEKHFPDRMLTEDRDLRLLTLDSSKAVAHHHEVITSEKLRFVTFTMDYKNLFIEVTNCASTAYDCLKHAGVKSLIQLNRPNEEIKSLPFYDFDNADASFTRKGLAVRKSTFKKIIAPNDTASVCVQAHHVESKLYNVIGENKDNIRVFKINVGYTPTKPVAKSIAEQILQGTISFKQEANLFYSNDFLLPQNLEKAKLPPIKKEHANPLYTAKKRAVAIITHPNVLLAKGIVFSISGAMMCFVPKLMPIGLSVSSYGITKVSNRIFKKPQKNSNEDSESCLERLKVYKEELEKKDIDAKASAKHKLLQDKFTKREYEKAIAVNSNSLTRERLEINDIPPETYGYGSLVETPYFNEKNKFNTTKLMLAAQNNKLDAIIYLLRHTGDLKLLKRDDFNKTALHYAVQHSNNSCFKVLFSAYKSKGYLETIYDEILDYAVKLRRDSIIYKLFCYNNSTKTKRQINDNIFDLHYSAELFIIALQAHDFYTALLIQLNTNCMENIVPEGGKELLEYFAGNNKVCTFIEYLNKPYRKITQGDYQQFSKLFHEDEVNFTSLSMKLKNTHKTKAKARLDNIKIFTSSSQTEFKDKSNGIQTSGKIDKVQFPVFAVQSMAMYAHYLDPLPAAAVPHEPHVRAPMARTRNRQP